jgi:GNAT superfamily N-acetyltransferase
MSQNPVPSIKGAESFVAVAARLHLDPALRSFFRGARVENEERFFRLVTRLPHPLGNFAVVSQSDELTTTEEVIRPLLDCGQPSAILYPAGTVAQPIDTHLREHGYMPLEMPVMAVDIDSLPVTSLPEGYTFQRVVGGQAAELWTDTFTEGYELPSEMADFIRIPTEEFAKSADLGLYFFAILREEKPVSTSVLYLHEGLAGIYCVATLPHERGRGLGTHITAEPLRFAQEMGYHVGVLQASEMGFPVYQKLGFQTFEPVPMYLRIPEG